MIMGLLTCMTGCAHNQSVTMLGAVPTPLASSPKAWIYLCGLTTDLEAEQEVHNREILDGLGKKLNFRVVAVHPFDRCEGFENKLCWPHSTPEQTLETYAKILKAVEGETISGFIGFSNGGYFLNALAQLKELHHPVISIGAAGSFNPTAKYNTLTLIVGKEEIIYDDALRFFEKAKGSPLNVRLIEHKGGHILPAEVLEKIL